ncbi:Rv3212 family protein [Actinokineospora spheciospongiae]|uniref:Rv3212 family protein n=1 Tax=Actinokineospora spheciospongiae TaxID=909613 RepID=UPI000D9A06ED|nr:hypothetical protein [Actinokineospora spheciospongiae]PWW65331.1 hypothetical protein DFQ13_10281 [Actinokineospora spheciospongiae]
MTRLPHDVAVEDVLDGDVPPVPAKPTRTRFTRRRDLVAASLLVVALLTAATLLWRDSDFRATTSTTADTPATTPPAPRSVPATLTEVWRADSPATRTPTTAGPSVITGQAGDVHGRDPLTGAIRWTYHRDLPLCTVGTAWTRAVAVHRTDGGALPESDPRHRGGCSEVSSLDGATGTLEATRNSDAEPDTHLLAGGAHLTTTGTHLLTTWHSNLVKSLEYGLVPTPVNPDRQPRPGCTHRSTLASANSIAVIERCAEEPADRLTVLKAVPEDADEPEVITSRLLPTDRATLVAMTDHATAIALPDPDRIAVYDEQGIEDHSHPLPLGAIPQPPTPLTTTAIGAFHWFTGTDTIALSTADLHPLWTTRNTLGPAATLAGHALVPVPEGLAVIDQSTGERVNTIPVDRSGYKGPVTITSIGPVVLEQRGPTLVALR